MQEFASKVAVVTGAGSGMGRAFAERFAREGMSVVLADIQEDALERAVAELSGEGFEVIGVPTDVSKKESLEAAGVKVGKTPSETASLAREILQVL